MYHHPAPLPNTGARRRDHQAEALQERQHTAVHHQVLSVEAAPSAGVHLQATTGLPKAPTGEAHLQATTAVQAQATTEAPLQASTEVRPRATTEVHLQYPVLQDTREVPAAAGQQAEGADRQSTT